MHLIILERFALQMLFRGSDALSIAVRAQLDASEVVARKATGVGFFTTIRLATPLSSIGQRQWDWNFKHRHLSYGGSLMCWFEDSSVLELKAVTHGGDWPVRFNPGDFSEAG